MSQVRVIDMHTHVLNARYFPIEGFVLSEFGSSDSARFIARTSAFLIATITGQFRDSQSIVRSLPGRASPEELVDRVWRGVETAIDESFLRYKGMSLAIHRDAGDVRSSVEQGLRRDSLFRVLHDIHAFHQSAAADGVSQGRESSSSQRSQDDCRTLDRALHRSDVGKARRCSQLAHAIVGQLAPEELLARGLRRGLFHRFREAVLWLLREIARLEVPAEQSEEGLLAFLLRRTDLETEMVRHLERAYEGKNVQYYAHHLVDLQHGYDQTLADGKTITYPAYYSYAEQQLLMSQLTAGSRKLFAFAAFDPRRADCLPLALDAMKRGFRGFKLYPPNGFRAWANRESSIQSRLEAFYEFCVDHDMAIFAHCSPGGFLAEGVSPSDMHPSYFKQALDQMSQASPRMRQLRLCLAHAGGGREARGYEAPEFGGGWCARSRSEWQQPDNFANGVVELCREYPNVYCEFGNLGNILENRSAEGFFRHNFIRTLVDESGNHAFRSKCMYGSDHQLPDRIDASAQYLEYFVALFENDKRLRPWLSDFCFDNAVRFMGL